MPQNKVERALEAIAHKGCDYCRECLTGLEQKSVPAEADCLSRRELEKLQVELKKIMAVYDD